MGDQYTIRVGGYKLLLRSTAQIGNQLVGEVVRVEGCGEPIVFRGGLVGLLEAEVSNWDTLEVNDVTLYIFSPLGTHTLNVNPWLLKLKVSGLLGEYSFPKDFSRAFCKFFELLLCREKLNIDGVEICGLGIKGKEGGLFDALTTLLKKKGQYLMSMGVNKSSLLSLAKSILKHIPYSGDPKKVLEALPIFKVRSLHPETRRRLADYLWQKIFVEKNPQGICGLQNTIIADVWKSRWVITGRGSLVTIGDERLALLRADPTPILELIERVSGFDLGVLKEDFFWLLKNLSFDLKLDCKEHTTSLLLPIFFGGAELLLVLVEGENIDALRFIPTYIPPVGTPNPTTFREALVRSKKVWLNIKMLKGLRSLRQVPQTQ